MRNYRPYLTKVARELRQHMTATEKILWEELRHHRQSGHHFRRQVPIGPYIADFACLTKKLIVEVDGRHHLENPQDAERDRWLGANRFRILRFQNDEILRNLPGVRDAIARALLSP